MTRTSITLAILAAATPTLAANPHPPFSTFFGTWKVVRILGATSVTESQQSANFALGTTVSISADLITTYDKHDTCKPHDTKVTEVDTATVLRKEFGTRMSDLSLPEGTLAPRTIYLDAGCALALLVDGDSLLWPLGNGYIYEIDRVRSTQPKDR